MHCVVLEDWCSQEKLQKLYYTIVTSVTTIIVILFDKHSGRHGGYCCHQRLISRECDGKALFFLLHNIVIDYLKDYTYYSSSGLALHKCNLGAEVNIVSRSWMEENDMLDLFLVQTLVKFG